MVEYCKKSQCIDVVLIIAFLVSLPVIAVILTEAVILLSK